MKNLDEEQERKLVARFVTSRTEANRNAVAEYYIRCELHSQIALKVWHRHEDSNGSGVTVGDFESELMIHMLSIIERYNPECNCSMFSWVSNMLEYKAWSLARAALRTTPILAFDEELENAGDNPITSADMGLDVDTQLDLLAAIEQLPSKYHDIIHMRYFEGLTGDEIAGRIGKKKARVSQLHGDAIERLRTLMNV